MSNVIQVLEQMGRDASLQNNQAIEQLLTTTELDSETSQAIVNKDINTLEKQMCITPIIAHVLHPAEEEENKDENKKENKDVKNAVNS